MHSAICYGDVSFGGRKGRLFSTFLHVHGLPWCQSQCSDPAVAFVIVPFLSKMRFLLCDKSQLSGTAIFPEFMDDLQGQLPIYLL